MSDKALLPAELEVTQRMQRHFPRGLEPQTLGLINGCPANILEDKLKAMLADIARSEKDRTKPFFKEDLALIRIIPSVFSAEKLPQAGLEKPFPVHFLQEKVWDPFIPKPGVQPQWRDNSICVIRRCQPSKRSTAQEIILSLKSPRRPLLPSQLCAFIDLVAQQKVYLAHIFINVFYVMDCKGEGRFVSIYYGTNDQGWSIAISDNPTVTDEQHFFYC